MRRTTAIAWTRCRSTRPRRASSYSCTRWTSSRGTRRRCWSGGRGSCKRRAVRCGSRCLARAFTTSRCIRYAYRQRFSFLPPPSPLFSRRESGLTSAGVVENRPHDHPKRGRSNETSDDVRASLQRHRSHPVRAHDLPRHRYLFPSGWPRASG